MWGWSSAQFTPRWMLPGGWRARASWALSAGIAVVMIAWVWSPSGPAGAHGLLWSPVLWSAVVVGALATNFRTFWLARGRRADAMTRAIQARKSTSPDPVSDER